MSSLSHLVRRQYVPRPVLVSAPAVVPAARPTFHDDLRDVVVTYLAGLVVFAVMLF